VPAGRVIEQPSNYIYDIALQAQSVLASKRRTPGIGVVAIISMLSGANGGVKTKERVIDLCAGL
jgi:hypothetical protein